MKKILLIALAILLVIIVWAALTDRSETEENVVDNTPNSTASTSPDFTATTTTVTAEFPSQEYCEQLATRTQQNSEYMLLEVQANDTIGSSHLVRGCVRNSEGIYGDWAPSEGQVGTIKVYASDDTLLFETGLRVVADNWLELANGGQSIAFEETLEYDTAGYSSGYFLIENVNPSGEERFSEEFRIPLNFNQAS